MKRNSIEVSREELYSEIWTNPVYKVAMKYGLSDVGLAKICNRNNIPKPPKGYWTKKAFGHEVEKPALPKSDNEKPIEIITAATQIGDEDPELLEKSASLIEFEKRPENKIIVPDRLQDPHPFMKASRQELREAAKDKNGLYHNTSWPQIAVTKPLIPRALIIMDTLLKALNSRGYNLDAFRIFDQPVAILLEEHLDTTVSERAKKRMEESNWDSYLSYYDYEHSPSGRLTLSLAVRMEGDGLQRNWTDGKTQRLENILNDFICGMTRQAAVSREWVLMWDREHREYEEEEQRKAREQARRAREEARKTQLRNDARNWELSALIKRYIVAVRESGTPPHPDKSLEQWIEWATEEVKQLDPLS